MRLSRAGDGPARGEGGDLREVLTALGSEGTGRRERGRLLLRLGRVVARRPAGSLSDLVTEVAEHLPVRDLLTLREHHGGLSGDALAAALVRTAARTTAAIGAAAGAAAAVEVAAPPLLLTAPAQLVAETLAVVVVELKCVAELHVVYGRAPVGTRAQVATAYLAAWAGRRAVDGQARPGLATIVGSAARTQLRSRLSRRLARNAASLAPFLLGAVAGAELNRRETSALGEAVRADLRHRVVPTG